MSAPTIRRSWLVQRLEKPWTLGQVVDNPFSFGGGLRNGGLSDEAMALTRSIWWYDYMGAAEFEFGAVPEALRTIAGFAGTDDLTAWSLDIPLTEVAPDWRDKSAAPKNATGTVYVLAPTAWRGEVETRIREWAKKGYAAHLKESAFLDRALRPYRGEGPRTVGWLELDNGFLFFTDRDMWSKACELFGVATASEVAS